MRSLTSSIILVLCFLTAATIPAVAQNATVTGRLGFGFMGLKSRAAHTDAGGLKIGVDAGVLFGYAGGNGDNLQWLLGFQYLGGHGGWISHDSTGIWLPNTFPQDSIEAGKKIKYKSSYLTIPFGVRLQTSEAQNLRFWAEVLPMQLSFRMGTKISIPDYDVKNVKARKETKLAGFWYEYGLGGSYTLGSNTSGSLGLSLFGSYSDLLKSPGKQVLRGWKISLRINFT